MRIRQVLNPKRYFGWIFNILGSSIYLVGEIQNIKFGIKRSRKVKARLGSRAKLLI
jgi:hypothetical protein